MKAISIAFFILYTKITMIKEEKEIIKLDDGREITLTTGKLAKQAHGSVEVRMGKTHLLATVVSSFEAREGVDFLPLTVDYREKFSADGRFPGGFLKREARPTDQEILVMRLVDRILRPMFPSDYHASLDIASQSTIDDEGQELVKLNNHDIMIEGGFGIDFYLQYFKFSPQIKISHGIINILSRDKTVYTQTINNLKTSGWMLSFTFE